MITTLARPFRLVPRLASGAQRISRSSSNTAQAPDSLAAAPSTEVTSPAAQSPNYPTTWSTNQRTRPTSGPRFEQTVLELQPAPLSAMELIANVPVIHVNGRKAVCDGGPFLFSLYLPQPANHWFGIQEEGLWDTPRYTSTWCVASLLRGWPSLTIGQDKPGPRPCGYVRISQYCAT
jgi:NADH dehydrogenase (ubiquinone) Fe-S protein 6